MIWLIGNKGMLGTEVARQLEENKIDFIGTDRDVDFTDAATRCKVVTGVQTCALPISDWKQRDAWNRSGQTA